MRVLLISNGYPPHRWAGAETYTAGIAKGLQLLGHKVSVLCAGDWDAGPDCLNGFTDSVEQGVPVRRLNLNWQKAPDPFSYLYDNQLVANFLTNYLEDLQPDLVHVISCETLSASVLRVAKDAGLPIVLSLVDFWFLCPRLTLFRSDGTNCDGLTTPWECLECIMRPSWPYKLSRHVLPANSVEPLLSTISRYPKITRQRGLRGMVGDMEKRKKYLHTALALADYRITASAFVRDVFIANGVQVPINVQSYGHDLSWVDRDAVDIHSDVLRIGFIGQIMYSKGVHILLKAVQILVKDYDAHALQVFVYGNMNHNPKYSSELFELVEDCENISFCGTYVHDESAYVFANMDVLVVPSLWFDFPLIIHEAFAAKTPVVATNLGGMAEAIDHGVDGLLFKRGDAEDLARQIKRLIEEPVLLQSLKEGIQPVKTILQEVKEFEEIYNDLIGIGESW